MIIGELRSKVESLNLKGGTNKCIVLRMIIVKELIQEY